MMQKDCRLTWKNVRAGYKGCWYVRTGCKSEDRTLKKNEKWPGSCWESIHAKLHYIL